MDRLATGWSSLNAPWGVAQAPAGFGQFGGDLLIGNRGDGHISAFDPATNAFVGQLANAAGNAIAIPGQWGLTFGNDHLGGSYEYLFFAAGIRRETHGLFGAIEPPQLRGDSTAGAGAFDPNFPGEVQDYPVPPATGPRLEGPTQVSIALTELQPLSESSLAMVPTLTLSAPASVGEARVVPARSGDSGGAAVTFVSTGAEVVPAEAFSSDAVTPKNDSAAVGSQHVSRNLECRSATELRARGRY